MDAAYRARSTLRSGSALLFSLLFTAVIGWASPIQERDTRVMRVGNVIGEPRPGAEPHHMVKTQRYFAKLVSEKTSGEIEVRFLEGKSLPVFRLPEMAAKGETIDAANVPGFFLVRVPEIDVQAIPYLFQGLEHARRFPRSAAAKSLAQRIEAAYGLNVVSFLKIASTASINAMEPIRMPTDFKGKKLANIWSLYDSMYRANPPSVIGEVSYTDAVEGALLTKEYDSVMGLLQNNHIQKLHTRFTHNTVAPFLYNIYYTFLVNRDFWSSLTPSQRAAIDEAARETENSAITFAQDAAQFHFDLLASEGVSMHWQTPEERKAWKDAFREPVLEALFEKVEDRGLVERLIREIEALEP